MEAADKELVIKMLKRDIRLQRLYNEHEKLEEKLATFHKRSFLTKTQELEQKKLKRKKLAGVDEMMEILRDYRQVAA